MLSSSSSHLTQHDFSVLEKIKDPEAGPSAPLLLDSSLPRDPHILDDATYLAVSRLEGSIIASIQAIELQIAGLKPRGPEAPLCRYLSCVTELDALIQDHPNYASARNNRAQALRRIYGDGVLVRGSVTSTGSAGAAAAAAPLDPSPTETSLNQASTTILSDLDTAIALLTPGTAFAALSPAAARTLSQAHTQRGALYHLSSKALSGTAGTTAVFRVPERREAGWTTLDFEASASRDFVLGGRYGNEVARALAVASNPTAKLCGAMVKEALLKEYGLGEVGSRV
jgi:hypothetical protein